MSTSNRIVFSINNKDTLKNNKLSNNKDKNRKDDNKKTKKQTYLLKPKNILIDQIPKSKTIYLKKPTTHSQYTRTLKTQVNKLYEDLYNNYILILFLDSKNKTNFISKIKELSLKLDNYNLTSRDIQKYKTLYSQLNKRIKQKILYSKTKKLKTSKSIFNKLGGDLPSATNSGPYLQRLTTKGNEPITGNDIAKTMEEIITVLSDLRYLDDAQGAYGPTVLLNYFMGDTNDLKAYLRFKLLPNYVKTNGFPSIEFKKIFERWDNITDLLNLYKNDKKIKNEWAVSQGLKPADVLKPTFIDKLATKIENADQKYQKLKAIKRGNLLMSI